MCLNRHSGALLLNIVEQHMEWTATRVFLRVVLGAVWIGAIGCSVHAGDSQQEGLGTEGHECLPGGTCHAGLECSGGGICIPEHVDPLTGGSGGANSAMASGGDTSLGAQDAGATTLDAGAGTGGSGELDGATAG